MVIARVAFLGEYVWVSVFHAPSLLRLLDPVMECHGRKEYTCRRIALLQENYNIEVEALNRFSLIVELVAIGVSFQLASRMAQLVCDEPGIGFSGGYVDVIAQHYPWITCLLTLLLKPSNAARCVSTLDISTGYIHSPWSIWSGIIIRLTLKDTLTIYCLLTLSLHIRHAGVLQMRICCPGQIPRRILFTIKVPFL